jgi:hypothetical protein
LEDEQILQRIAALAEEEQHLELSHAQDGLSTEQQARLAAIEVALDQCRDLLRRRRARRDAGLDPDDATVQPKAIDEGYQQ